MAPRRGDTQKTLKRPQDRLDVFPAFMKVAGERVLVVGHGGEAAAKVRLLGRPTQKSSLSLKLSRPIWPKPSRFSRPNMLPRISARRI